MINDQWGNPQTLNPQYEDAIGELEEAALHLNNEAAVAALVKLEAYFTGEDYHPLMVASMLTEAWCEAQRWASEYRLKEMAN